MSHNDQAETSEEQNTWDDTGVLVASTTRATVARDLAESNSSPAKIADDTGIEVTNVSRALSTFKTRGMAELLNPSARKGRIYALTDRGRRAVENFESEYGESQ